MWQVAFNKELQKLAISITPTKEALRLAKVRGTQLFRGPIYNRKTRKPEVAHLHGGLNFIYVPRKQPAARSVFLHELGHAIDLPTRRTRVMKHLARLTEAQGSKNVAMIHKERAANSEARALINKASKNPKADVADYERNMNRVGFQAYRLNAVVSGAKKKLPPPKTPGETVDRVRAVSETEGGSQAQKLMHKIRKRTVPGYKRAVKRYSRENRDILRSSVFTA